MSLSALGQQLAALNDPSRNVGSVRASSKSHDEAIGRGMGFSVQVGHAIANKSHLYKPSIIHEDAKKAADVPLTTIQDNCDTSLKILQNIEPNLGLNADFLRKESRERAMMTLEENERIDTSIGEFIVKLVPLFANNRTKAPCLHVVEYLLRKHDIHLRPKLASSMILSMLPFHENPFTLRFLQLVDLASMPTWTFLRPFAAPGAFFARQLISKQAAKDIALLRELCRLASNVSEVRQSDRTLSFIAAVIVEAVTLQTNHGGSIEEQTCKVLLQHVMKACKCVKVEAYQNWGFVVASCIVENSVLAGAARQALTMSILEGMANPMKPNGQQNGLMLCLSILSHSGDGEKYASLLPMIGSLPVGLHMDETLFPVIAKVAKLAPALGQIYEEEGVHQIAHMVSSIIVLGWQRAKRKIAKGHKSFDAQVMIALIQEPRLRELWTRRHGQLAASYVCYILTSFQEKDGGNSRLQEAAKKLLSRIQVIEPSGYDTGVAHSLTKANQACRATIASLLGHKHDDSTISESKIIDLLPPRVALEHADADVRAAAVDRAIQAEKRMQGAKHGTESLVDTLIRRFSMEEDKNVALIVAQALPKLLRKGAAYSPETQEIVLESLYRWSGILEQEDDEILKYALLIISLMNKNMPSEKESTLYAKKVEILGAHLNGPLKDEATRALFLMSGVREEESEASIMHASYSMITSEKVLSSLMQRESPPAARRAERLLRHRFTCAVLDAQANSLDRKLDQVIGDDVSAIALKSIKFCLWVLQQPTSEMASCETSLQHCLTVAAKNSICTGNALLQLLWSLASVPSDTFDKFVVPMLKSLCEHVKDLDGMPVSMYAMLMEAALSGKSSLILRNLLSFCRTSITQDPDAGIQYLFVPALSIMAYPNEEIRSLALDVIISMHSALDQMKNNDEMCDSLREFCSHIFKSKSSILLGSVEGVTAFLTKAVSESKDAQKLYKSLCSLCVCCTMAYGHTPSSGGKQTAGASWLPMGMAAAGGYHAASTVLKMLGLINEDKIPLQARWALAGSLILESFLSSKNQVNDLSLTESKVDLIGTIMQMLRGICVTNHEMESSKLKIIISSGPTTNGGRTRSYSVGKIDDLQLINPYPQSMIDAICSILSGQEKSTTHMWLQESLCRDVLSDSSWSKLVFCKLGHSDRRKIFSLLVNNANSTGADYVQSTLFALPIGVADLSKLLPSTEEAGRNSFQISLVADYVFTNAKSLAASGGDISPVVVALFNMLALHSTANGAQDEDAAVFTCQSVLAALAEIYDMLESASKSRSTKLTRHKYLSSWINTLQGLLGGSPGVVRPLKIVRSKTITLKLLSSMCQIDPSSVVDTIIPALTSTMEAEVAEGRISPVHFQILLPVFCKHVRSGSSSLAQLFMKFTTFVLTLDSQQSRQDLYKGFIGGLLESSFDDDVSAPGGLIATILALRRQSDFNTGRASINEIVEVLQLCPVKTQVEAIICLIDYVKAIVQNLSSGAPDNGGATLFSVQELQSMVLQHVSTDPDAMDVDSTMTHPTIAGGKVSLLSFCRYVMLTVTESLTGKHLLDFVRSPLGADSGLSLRLWQDLLLLQSIEIPALKSMDTVRTQSMLNDPIKESLEHLQNNLPLPIFLASTTALIIEGETPELRSRAIRLLADRVYEVDPASAESALFFDTLPMLAKLLAMPSNGKPLLTILQQSALFSVETIARVLHMTEASNVDTQYRSSVSRNLMTAAAASCAVLHVLCESLGSDNKLSPISTALSQHISAAASCCSALVRACGNRSIPLLAKIMDSLTEALAATHRSVLSSGNSDIESTRRSRILQVSILRSLNEVVVTLPKFIFPFLKKLLSKDVLCSNVLHDGPGDEDGDDLKDAASIFEKTLATQIPPGELIPVVSAAVCDFEGSLGLKMLLSILQTSVDTATSSNLMTNSHVVLQACLHVFEVSNRSDGVDFVTEANDVLLALILKISEIKLRSLFMKVREWRGDFDPSKPDKNAHRRRAFWTLAAILGAELKTIFLPSLSAVLVDAVDELTCATSNVCEVVGRKVAGGSKKQKLSLGVKNVATYQSSLEALKPLLQCLEVSLEADSREGGEWIRADESHRYSQLVEPLGKLLKSDFNGFLMPSGADKNVAWFDHLVEGSSGDKGSVIGTLVSLASAAGDEQLWKPLNHAVLQASSHEHRAEVRRAGVSCLLELIKTLGEEYMVLLPECLPVLSELLEDDDERIAGIARDCIELSEELLGESLEESLR